MEVHFILNLPFELLQFFILAFPFSAGYVPGVYSNTRLHLFSTINYQLSLCGSSADDTRSSVFFASYESDGRFLPARAARRAGDVRNNSWLRERRDVRQQGAWFSTGWLFLTLSVSITHCQRTGLQLHNINHQCLTVSSESQ